MKVLFISDVPLENPVSGSEQVLNQQATGLARDGMDVYAITRQSVPPKWVIRNVNGVQEGTYSASTQNIIHFFLPLIKYPKKLYGKFIQNGSFEVIICHQPFNCLSLFILRNIRRIPLLYNFHSPSHEEYLLLHENRSLIKNLLPSKARKSIEKFCLKRACKIMVESRYMKQKVMDIHRMPIDRIEVNPGGVDLDHFKTPQNRDALKKERGFPENRVHLLTLRNLEPRMGLDNLLKAMFILKEKQTNVHLIIGGEGIEQKNLEKLILEYGLTDDVTMTGFIPSELLPQYYGAADFFILPTRRLEGFGLVTPESMACGTPVLGTPVGGTKEILSGFGPRFLFRDTSPESIADGIRLAIKEYFHDKNKYKALRLRCREYTVNKYSWKRHTDHLTRMLQEVIHDRRSVSEGN